MYAALLSSKPLSPLDAPLDASDGTTDEEESEGDQEKRAQVAGSSSFPTDPLHRHAFELEMQKLPMSQPLFG